MAAKTGFERLMVELEGMLAAIDSQSFEASPKTFLAACSAVMAVGQPA
jgi:hypothetical protein